MAYKLIKLLNPCQSLPSVNLHSSNIQKLKIKILKLKMYLVFPLPIYNSKTT